MDPTGTHQHPQFPNPPSSYFPQMPQTPHYYVQDPNLASPPHLATIASNPNMHYPPTPPAPAPPPPPTHSISYQPPIPPPVHYQPVYPSYLPTPAPNTSIDQLSSPTLPPSASVPMSPVHPAIPPQQPQPSLATHPSILPPQPPAVLRSYYPTDPSSTPAQRLLQTAEVRLEISANGLRNRDVGSLSDPTCVVFLEDRYSSSSSYHMAYGHLEPGHSDAQCVQNTRKWREVARTECIKNDLNPHFKVQVKVPYHFEELQHIRLGLWDIDSKKIELNKHDFLGEVRTTLGELVAARVWSSKLTSTNLSDRQTFFRTKRDLGTIKVIVHETQDGGNLLIKARLSGRKLDRKDLFPFSSDPYFIITQIDSSSQQSRSQLYKSEVIRRNVNPVWKPCQFKAVVPKGGNETHVILEFAVNDKDRRSRDDEIGVAKCSVTELKEQRELPLINEARRERRRRYTDSGMLQINNFSAVLMPSLVDYLQGGLKLHFSVAIDLTASNGTPTDHNSLHYCANMYSGNHYIHALTAVANVIRVYTPSDNQYAAFGFGAKLPSNPGITNSCFPLSLGPDPRCHGIEGILRAYNTALSSVRLSGPTNFAPLIDAVSRNSERRPNSQTDQNYDVLLILTDGVVSDFEETVERIINASKRVPLSIIIVGIGDRDFQKMKDIDCDDKLLTSSCGTKQAARDICQFVAFNEFKNAPPERLGAAVLQELPGNIVEYFIGICDPPIMPGQRPVFPNLNY